MSVFIALHLIKMLCSQKSGINIKINVPVLFSPINSSDLSSLRCCSLPHYLSEKHKPGSSQKSMGCAVILLVLWALTSSGLRPHWARRHRCVRAAAVSASHPAGPDTCSLLKPHLVSALSGATAKSNKLSAARSLPTQTPCCPLDVAALSLDSVLILLKTASVYLISALRGLCKVLSFKNGPSVQKHFLHLCSAHRLSGVWRGAAALWICSQICKYVRGCFSCSDSAEWSDVWTDRVLFMCANGCSADCSLCSHVKSYLYFIKKTFKSQYIQTTFWKKNCLNDKNLNLLVQATF